MMSDTLSGASSSVSASVSHFTHSEDNDIDIGVLSEDVHTESSGLEGMSDFHMGDAETLARHSSDKSASSKSAGSDDKSKLREFTSLKNAIKLMNVEAIKAEELYKAENMLLQKANDQLMKFSRLIQEQDVEIAEAEEALNKERKQRESAEKHFIKLKKMMVVKDVEVSEAEQRKKSEVALRKGAEKEMTMLRRQLQAKESQITATERKYQKECKRREKFESQMMEIAKKAGKQSAEEKYQILQNLRKNDDDSADDKRDDRDDYSFEPAKSKESIYDKWKNKDKGDSSHQVAVLMAQLNDVQDQLKSTEADLQTANEKFDRERQLREESDKQLIVMREKGFAYHVDRRTSARTHAEDCLNTERLKLRNADLQEQYEILKAEARKALEKARDRVQEEKTSREALEEQMASNRKHFEEALEREKKEHKKKMEELAQKVTEAGDFQAELKEARESCKKEKALRDDLQMDMKVMEDVLDSMEKQLEDTKQELQDLEAKYQELEASHETLQEQLDIQAKTKQEEISETQKERDEQLSNLESLLQDERDQRAAQAKELEDLRIRTKELEEVRATQAESNLTHLEAKEKIKMLEEEIAEVADRWRELKASKEKVEDDLQAVEARCKLFKEKYQKEQELKEKSREEAFKAQQSVKQLTADLEQAKTQQDDSRTLREKIERVTSNFQDAMTQAESSEKRLQEQMTSLTLELEEANEKCASLQQSLNEAKTEIFKEKELRRAVEENLSLDERSLARKRREESEQDFIGIQATNYQAIRAAEDKMREEKRRRQELEEQCRTLREEIHRLKHEQILSNNTGSSNEKAQLESRLAALRDDLELAESRRRTTKESLDRERKLREDLEKQNQAFRDMIPEYEQAEERYQNERRLRSEAESTIEALRQKVMGNKFWDKDVARDESTIETNDHTIMQEHVAELQTELESVRSQCEKAEAALQIAHERSDREKQLREEAESQLHSVRLNRSTLTSLASPGGNEEVERKLREKAEKQVMSMRLKIEAKETEIASLKSRLSQSQSSGGGSDTKSSRRQRSSAKKLSKLASSPSPQPSRQLEYRASYQTARTYDEQTSQQIHAQEQQNLRQQIMATLPEYVKSNFGRIGFVKHSAFDFWPALVLDPFTVPLSVRTKWLELYYEFDKRDMFLVYLYGRRHRDSVNAYPIVEPHHFISYEEGVERNLDQLPALIEDKLRYGDQLAEIEEEYSDGLTQIRIDSRQQPTNRTHPLDESRAALRDTPSITSSTSYTSSLRVDEELLKLQDVESPRRPRSEYSVPRSGYNTPRSGIYAQDDG